MEVGETLDVSGWEMARSLRPVRVLNASVLVWPASPIVCRKPPVFAGMKELAAGDHHPRVGICHCLDMREEPPRRALTPEEALPCSTPDTGSTPDSGTGHGSSVPFEDLFAAELERELLPHVDRLLKEKKWLRTSGITAGIPVAAPLHHMDERLMHPEDRGTRWRRVMQAV